MSNISAHNMNEIVGTHNILFVTLDTLRFDVAKTALDAGQTPGLAKFLGQSGWQRRHTPANFTYAAHHAFFAGFLPTPIGSRQNTRLFAAKFHGSESIGDDTCVFDQANIVEGLANRGYETHCIGGVGFFNQQTPLGCVLPSFFQNSYWSTLLGVTCRESTENQVDLARRIIEETTNDARLFLFINVSALHQPNCHYLSGATQDSCESQMAALTYVDRSLGPLWMMLESRPPWFVIVCSDHGTAYGEDNRIGHRWNHTVIGDVPYADFVIQV